MSVFRNLEARIEGLVEGVFSRAFSSEVQPVELARKLAKEMDSHKTASVSRVYVPNEYTVHLSEKDRDKLEGYERSLEQELSGYLLEHARRKGYDLLTRPEVHFNTDSRLRLGEFGIQARLVKPPSREGELPQQADEGHTMVYKVPPAAAPADPTDRATQKPALTRAGGFPGPEALEGAREIAPDPAGLFRALKRVEVREVGRMDDAALAGRIGGAEQVLAIVDNRMQARGLFDAIRGVPGAAHLSTLMVPAHRRAVLAELRARLRDGMPVRLVSTSLIEAGVDVDFPLVLRAAAGIDSVAQAAGRCNREGKLDGLGQVEVFQSEHPAPPAVEQFAVIGRQVLAEWHEDPIGEDAVASYFRRLWDAYGPEALDAAEVGPARIRGILTAISRAGAGCPFEQIEKAFRIIPDGERSVIVLDGEWGVPSADLENLRHGSAGAVAKLVQPHAVNVPWRLWATLRDGGHISWWAPERFQEQFAVLQNSDLYDARAGLSGEGEPGGIF